MRYRTLNVYRHSRITRITHAVFFLAFAGLALTGTQMYLHKHWLVNVGTLHQIFGVTMIACGIAYLAAGLFTGQLTRLLLGPRDVAGLVPMIAYYARLRETAPAYEGYNPLQKLAYTAVLLMIGPLMAATGLAIWPHVPLFHALAQLFGGRAARVWHLGFAIELVAFFGGHMVMVATTGLRNNLRSIVTGWYRERVAVREDIAA
jgi:thiosulfate reductase cytochrome b subunit